jgi:hypothetical protein
MPQRPAKAGQVDILHVSIYLVVVLYRRKHHVVLKKVETRPLTFYYIGAVDYQY